MTVLVAVAVVGGVGALEARRAETRRVDRLLVVAVVVDILIISMELEGSC